MDLLILFKKHIQDLFPADAEYVSDGNTKIRVSFSLTNHPDGRKRAQPVALIFDRGVIQAYATAEQNADFKRIERYKYSLRRIIVASLSRYDPSGSLNVAHRIEIDDRATDL